MKNSRRRNERKCCEEKTRVYVMDVQFDDETVGRHHSGLESWVQRVGRKEDVRGKTSKLLPKKAGVGLVAANGTPIEHHGQRQVRFRGV